MPRNSRRTNLVTAPKKNASTMRRRVLRSSGSGDSVVCPSCGCSLKYLACFLILLACLHCVRVICCWIFVRVFRLSYINIAVPAYGILPLTEGANFSGDRLRLETGNSVTSSYIYAPCT